VVDRPNPLAEPDPAPDPSEPASSTNVVGFPSAGDWLEQRRNSAVLRGVNGLEGDQGDASRAIRLSKTNGLPPQVNYLDIDQQIAEEKAKLTAAIIKQHSALQEYVRENPLAAEVSQNDWGQFSKLEQVLHSVMPLAATPSDIKAAAHGFIDLHGTQPTGSSITGQLGIMDLGPVKYGDTPAEKIFRNIIGHSWPVLLQEEGMRIAGGLSGALGGVLGKRLQESGFTKNNEYEAISQALLDPALAVQFAHLGPEAETALYVAGTAARFSRALQIAAHVGRVQDVAKDMRVIRGMEPWVRNGEMPKQGTDPAVDQMWKDKALHDQKSDAEILAEIKKLQTTKDQPGYVENFLNQERPGQAKGAKVGIPSEVVQSLYGDKLPIEDDGMLGFVPELQRQMDNAKRRNMSGDILVDRNKLLVARANNPEFDAFIKDHIRQDPEGMTPDEARNYKPPEEPKEETLWERPQEGEAKPEPKISEAPPRYTIREVPPSSRGWMDVAEGHPELKVFDILEDGKEIGGGLATIQGDTLRIENIRAFGPAGIKPNRLGPLALRELWQQVSEQYPGITKITGHRVTGARVWSGDGPTEAMVQVRKASGLEESPAPKGWQVAPGETDVSNIIPPEHTVREGTVELAGKKYTPDFSFRLGDAMRMVDPENLGAKEGSSSRIIHDFFANRIARIAGDVMVHVLSHEDIEDYGKIVEGGLRGRTFYDYGSDSIYLSPDVIRANNNNFVLMHEGAHALTSMAMFRFPEIKSAVTALMKHTFGWISENKPELLKDQGIRYAFKNENEFIAQGYSFGKFRDLLGEIKVDRDMLDFAKGQGWGTISSKSSVWDVFKEFVRHALSKVFGTEVKPTVLHAMFELEQRMEEQFKVSRKNITKEGAPYLKEEAPPERIPDIGMKNKKMERSWYEAVIREAQKAGDWAKEYALKIAHQQETAEWKENLAKVREQVAERLENRPDLAVDNALRNGIRNGEKIGFPFKIGTDSVTAEEMKGLPKEYFSSRGFDAEQIAQAFGFETKEQMLEVMRNHETQREMEGLTPQAHFSKEIDAEAEREMLRQHGTLQDKVIEAANEHMIDPAMQRLSEDIHRVGMQTEGKPPWDDAEVKRMEREALQKEYMSDLNPKSDKRDAHRNGELAKQALLDGKPEEGLRHQQSQFMHLYHEKLATQIQEARAKFEKRVKRLSQREVKGIDQRDLLYIHEFLNRIGEEIPRSPTQQAEALATAGTGDRNLRAYAERVNRLKDLYSQDPDRADFTKQLDIPEGLLDPPPPGQNKPLGVEHMTVEEFRSASRALESFEKYAKNESRIMKGERELDFRNATDGLIARLKAAMGNVPLSDKIGPQTRPFRTLGSWLLTPETWFQRLDTFNPRGPFHQLLLRPLLEGQYQLRTWEREAAKEWNALGPWEDHYARITNGIELRDSEGRLKELTVDNARTMLANLGNPLQRKKFFLGWELAKNEAEIPMVQERVFEWLFRPRDQGGAGLTKVDLERSQKMGKIFEKAFDKAAVAYSERGVVPDKIDLGKFDIPGFGPTDEWYFPLRKDPIEGSKVPIDPARITDEGGGYYRPRPSHGYTEARTGALYRIDLNMMGVSAKLKQILNDAAMKNPVYDVGKIIYDEKFSTAFKKYYGAHYYAGLEKWLRDVSGTRPWIPSNDSAIYRGLMESGRMMNSLFIGVNAGTLAKHFLTATGQSIGEVGAMRLLKHLTAISKFNDDSKALIEHAFTNSLELPNRMRMMTDNLSGVDRSQLYNPGKLEKFGGFNWAKFKGHMEEIGHYPVAMSDLYVSTAMWLADEEKQALAHPDWEQADLNDHADTAVRRTHGSTIIANRPQILRTHPVINLLTPVYNFMSSILQRVYEAGTMSKLMVRGRELPEMEGFPAEQYKANFANIRQVGKRALWSGLMVVAVEEIVRHYLLGQRDKPSETGLEYAAKIGTHMLSNVMPGPVRDMISNIVDNRESGLGGFFAGTIGEDIPRVARDFGKGISGRTITDPGKTLRSANRVAGMLGLPTWDHFIGSGSQFLYNVYAGRERPKDLADWGKGMYFGTIKPSRPR
jgi:hypothetical protein